jgi:hypothetical protein
MMMGYNEWKISDLGLKKKVYDVLTLSSPNIITMFKPRKMRWAGHV